MTDPVIALLHREAELHRYSDDEWTDDHQRELDDICYKIETIKAQRAGIQSANGYTYTPATTPSPDLVLDILTRIAVALETIATKQ